MQAGELRNKIDVYGMRTYTDTLGSQGRKPGKIKSLWANIVPTSGQNREEKGNVSEIYVSHRVTVRRKSLSEIAPDYYLVYKGQKYEILYWYPNYKNNNYMEIFCRLEVSV